MNRPRDTETETDDLFIYAIAPHEFDANDESTAIQIENGILSLKTQQRERQRQRHRERQRDTERRQRGDRETHTESKEFV